MKNKCILVLIFISTLILEGCNMGVLIPNATKNAAWHGGGGDSYWTVPTPSSDTRIMYVSADGDDSTANIYAPTDVGLDDPFDPQGEIFSFATIAEAENNLRSGYADWVLFKRGDTFNDQFGWFSIVGRSADERLVIGAYGSSGLSPIIQYPGTDGVGGFKTSVSSSGIGMRNLYMLGIDWYQANHDPDNALYEADSGTSAISIGGAGDSTTLVNENITIEGCIFRFGTGVSVTTDDPDLRPNAVEFRRCVFLSALPNSSGHCSGLWGKWTQITLDECIMDHNGWYDKSDTVDPIGPATIFNHNTYLASCYNTTFKNTIFTRSSSLGNKFTGATGSDNIVLNNNFYMGSDTGPQFGLNYADQEDYRFTNIEIKNNVIQDVGWDAPTDRGLGWGIVVEGFDGLEISDNVIFTRDQAPLTSIQGINVAGGTAKNGIIHDNVVSTDTGITYFGRVGPTQDGLVHTDSFSWYDNIFNGESDDISYIFDLDSDREYTFSNNWYYAEDTTLGMEEDDITLDRATWLADYEPNATFSLTPYAFVDDTRTVETYLNSLGMTATKDSFIEQIRAQNRYNWNEDISADNVNNWIKEGWL